MSRLLSLALLVCVCVTGRAADKPREALALKAELDGDTAKLTVAFNYTGKPGDPATFQGVRLYKYDVAVDNGPVAVGWQGKEGRQSAVVAGKKYTYYPAQVDRQENGSLSVTTAGGKVRITGVYHAYETLFVIDETVKPGDPILLEAKPAEDKMSFDLRDADGKVLVSADEITAYDWATHTLTTKPEVAARLRKLLRDARKLDTPFVAAVGGKTVYEGKLTTVLSSRSLSTVVIVVDPLENEKGVKEEGIRIQLGYPGDGFFKGTDPRGDDSVKTALKATGKIK